MNHRFTKLLTVLTAAFLILALFPLQAFAASHWGEQDGFKYYVDSENKVRIQGYTGAGGAVTVPDTIEGLPVIQILPFTNANITDVTLGAKLREMDYAFERWTKLGKIHVSAQNKIYASDAYGVLYNKGMSILMLYPRGSLRSGYTVPEGVKTIVEMALAGCSGLKNVYFPETLRSIQWGAFENCTGLQKISIPKGLTTIEPNAFYGATGLKQFTVEAGNAKYSSRDGVLFDKSQKTLLYYPAAKSASTYSIPGTVQRVENPFNGCAYLKTLNIPNSVTSMAMPGFIGCSRLVKINVSSGNRSYSSSGGVLFNKAKTMLNYYPAAKAGSSYTVPANVKSIRNQAFAGNTQLKTVKLHKGLTTIGSYAFAKCTGLSSIDIPNSVTQIGTYAFAGSGIQKVTLRSGITYINSGVFMDCTRLTGIDIPQGVQSIQPLAFQNCASLKTATIPYTVILISDKIFEGCKDLTIRGYTNSAAEKYAAKKGIHFTSIGKTPSYKIAAVSNKAAYGSVTGAGSYYYGAICALTAHPAEGYYLSRWADENGKAVGRSLSYSFWVKDSGSFKAVFAKK